ncbi:Hypothetical protein LUCI_3994 [Lucifera butyrica]|uniref:Molybdopterin molybdenumtransferase n=1 Tax=Lucifera butyrica TaxID=1351585 RepID=A0A498R7H7_9FIRM|nr:molybdopterin-binding protein [Lucifera butyrica]VBB08716.1 Hypothetical protein LUCI_3994 [Lucifera butyrica]
MALKKVRVEDAVGMVLAHDMTKIVPGEYKGPLFQKGHIIRAEDIPHLKDIGKEHIYLLEIAAGQLHENEAVARIARAVAGENVELTVPVEGKIIIRAARSGLLKIRRNAVMEINRIEHMVLSTIHENMVVQTGDSLAGVKVVPLVVAESAVCAVEQIAAACSGSIIYIKPLQKLKVGTVITGNEVYFGRIQDRYAAVFAEKLAKYGATLMGTVYLPDDCARIAAAIETYKQQGADLIITAGGMSVDPDDVTPDAIRASGAQVISYGAPVLPGAMFMLAYFGDTAVLGMPACGMYSKITVLDLVLPRLLAGERLNKADIANMGYGGFCRSCDRCSYPCCSFGKSS